ncbi:hypothetical protein BJV74DRAFT_834861 [Russula compacta]|nr:hypothetical protein BJV74DRAFT_834861 [Russula compacta]
MTLCHSFVTAAASWVLWWCRNSTDVGPCALCALCPTNALHPIAREVGLSSGVQARTHVCMPPPQSFPDCPPLECPGGSGAELMLVSEYWFLCDFKGALSLQYCNVCLFPI